MELIEFEIEGEFIELFKLLKASGVCSTGGEAKMLIEDGEVSVNGEAENRKRRKVRSGDEVEIFDTYLKIL